MLLPPEYGNPNEVLEWSEVDGLLRDAAQYWVASVRSEADRMSYLVMGSGLTALGTREEAMRPCTIANLRSNPLLTMHIGAS
jgi:hypothetical protein